MIGTLGIRIRAVRPSRLSVGDVNGFPDSGPGLALAGG